MHYTLNFSLKRNEINPNYLKKNKNYEETELHNELKTFKNKNYFKTYLSPQSLSI